jgi:hypothetical protein
MSESREQHEPQRDAPGDEVERPKDHPDHVEFAARAGRREPKAGEADFEPEGEDA